MLGQVELTAEQREWARQAAARLKPLTAETRGELAMLLRPAVVAARRQARRGQAAKANRALA